jgi:hypothetical protein
MEGAFQVEPCATRPRDALRNRGTGRCLQQMIAREPVKWARVPTPLTLVGDATWSDYTVSVAARIGPGSSSTLLGRVNDQLNTVGTGKITAWEGYSLNVSDAGAWSLQVLDPDKTTRVLASGSLGGIEPGSWSRLRLSFSGARITARIDAATVAEVTDTTYAQGQIGLATGTYSPTAQFDDLSAVAVHRAP